jgi:hypothetical protein
MLFCLILENKYIGVQKSVDIPRSRGASQNQYFFQPPTIPSKWGFWGLKGLKQSYHLKHAQLIYMA